MPNCREAASAATSIQAVATFAHMPTTCRRAGSRTRLAAPATSALRAERRRNFSFIPGDVRNRVWGRAGSRDAISAQAAN